jgi:hypothetical protein
MILGATKFRLWLDFIVQTLCWILLIFQLPSLDTWKALLNTASIFALFISLWQLLNAYYVTQKYGDWDRKIYLYHMRQLLGYLLLTLGICFLMLLGSFGYMAAFFYFTLEILQALVSLVVFVLSIQFYRKSFLKLQAHLKQPKSFWDL